MSTRYVVSMRTTGIGDRLICLGAAWRFARSTGRTLVADWRFSRYSPDLGKNLFSLCFEPRPELAGVPFLGDDRVGGFAFPSPRHPAVWNDDRVMKAPFLRPAHGFVEGRDEAVALIRGGGDVPAATVVFDACVNDGLVLTRDSRTFLEALRPAPKVAAQVARFRRERLGEGPLIGLHLRQGNGAVTGHDEYWRSVPAAIERCARAVQQARGQLGGSAPVFLCTDNADLEGAVREQIRGVVCRPKLYRRPGEGELHLWDGAHQGREDALVEMLLLAECDALIRYPPGSFFSFYGAVMKRWRGPVPETVYDLQRPCSDDPLAPALLV